VAEVLQTAPEQQKNAEKCFWTILIQIKYSYAIHVNQLRNNFMKPTKILLSIAGAVALATSAHADLIDIQAQWSGASFGNGASATALFTLDTSAFDQPGLFGFLRPHLCEHLPEFSADRDGCIRWKRGFHWLGLQHDFPQHSLGNARLQLGAHPVSPLPAVPGEREPSLPRWVILTSLKILRILWRPKEGRLFPFGTGR